VSWVDRLAPKVASRRIKVAIAASAIAFVALAVQLGFAYSEMHEPFQPVLAVLLCLEAIFLWLAKPWAIATARWCWGAIIVLLIFGCVVNPFFWHDFPSNTGSLGLALPALYLLISISGFQCWRVLRSYGGRT